MWLNGYLLRDQGPPRLAGDGALVPAISGTPASARNDSGDVLPPTGIRGVRRQVSIDNDLVCDSWCYSRPRRRSVAVRRAPALGAGAGDPEPGRALGPVVMLRSCLTGDVIPGTPPCVFIDMGEWTARSRRP